METCSLYNITSVVTEAPDNSMIQKTSAYTLIVFFVMFYSFAASSAAADASDRKIKVIASIAPLADFARQVGREHVDVVLLLPPGASPHTYEPTPKTIREISRAQIFIRIGAGLEFWADKMIRAANSSIHIVTVSEGVGLITGGTHAHPLPAGRQAHDRDHLADPHIWLDPLICVTIIEKIERAFSLADPARSPEYKRNASDYISRLTELDREISERTKQFSTREYITFHPAWNYFSKRYGLRVAGVVEEGPGKEPTPKHLQKILVELRRFRTKVIFAEPQFSPKTAEAIAAEAGGKVLFLDPVGGQKGRETYIDMMRYNIAVMEQAMK